ncbi:SAM-dependent methyltransferase [Actinosynnema pretiosum]|uniref:SAM-dependent methyltransferase n=1 Tax=Actinosynnema pretiosum TaxID=42197 RepID=A0A290Z801_9PSEU|nr:SAM-dependent methyltransferase [Actinosynnema pretiosum]ATE55147.1 SAM-dependent methyltransferase [Actinosynnema pretiosum]
MQQATHPLTAGEAAAERERGTARDGLARTARASRPAALAGTAAARTPEPVAGRLDRPAPVGSALEIGCGAGGPTPTTAARVPALHRARTACAGMSTADFPRASVRQVPLRKSGVAVRAWALTHGPDEDGPAEACRRIAAPAHHPAPVERERARVPVGRRSRPRRLAGHPEPPAARLVERSEPGERA